jgi:hypothetical protein
MATNALHPPRARRGAWLLVVVAAVVLLGGAALWWGFRDRLGGPASDALLEQQARHFVTLALTLGRIAEPEVDSYFGPADLAPPAGVPVPSPASLHTDLAQFAAALRTPSAPSDHRRQRLEERTKRLLALVDVMGRQAPLPFDEEARTLYGVEPGSPDGKAFAQAREALDRLLPGGGSLTARVEAFRQRFIIPEALRPAVFDRALAECRQRTLQHWRLPKSETLDVEWTNDVDAAWHRYKGNFHSTLQVNPQAVAFLGSAVDVACHEGYPGHHAQFALAEMMAGTRGLPVEDRIVLLRSPGSVVREGAADYAVSLVLPPQDRLAFERDVLFPMAGFPPAEAARFEQVRQLIAVLAPAALPILRAYRDRTISAEAAAEALDRDALIASPRALLGFVDTLGAYVTGYTIVREQVRSIVDADGAPAGDIRWARLRRLIQLADEAPLSQMAGAISKGTAPALFCGNAIEEVKK